MNGVANVGMRSGWPATEIVRLAADRPMPRREPNEPADEALVAGITHPPRIGEARAIAALMPQVLARYGLPDVDDCQASNALDVLA